MVSLSLLSTGHPLSFQPKWVRPSTGSYPRFSLPMDRSPGFASAARDSCRPVRTRCRCGWLSCFASPRTATRWLILQKARRHGSWPLRLLVGARFQVLFHSPPGVLFTFPSRYWFAIGHGRVFRIGGWSPRLRTAFHVRGPTQGRRPRRSDGRGLRGPNPVPPAFPCRSARPGAFAPGPAGPGCSALQPHRREGCRPRATGGLSSAPFRSPLLGGSRS